MDAVTDDELLLHPLFAELDASTKAPGTDTPTNRYAVVRLSNAPNTALGLTRVDMVWFGVMMTTNLEIGLITPPVGLNLDILRSVSPQVPLRTVLAGSMPFVGLMIAGMVIMAFLPEIALWLPRALR